MNVAVIPARGGSERIPRKNIREFCGRPIIGYSIDAARASELFEHIVVSTDDDEIAEVARSLGADVPFRRPPELADAFTGTAEVIAHAVEWMRAESWPVSAVCCVYPTAPLLSPQALRRGLERLEEADWAFVVAACEFPSSIFRAFQTTSSGGLKMVFPDAFDERSQDLPRVLHDAGQFYWGRPEAWLRKKRMFEEYSSAIVLPRSRVQDIDTPDDWIRAERMYLALAEA